MKKNQKLNYIEIHNDPDWIDTDSIDLFTIVNSEDIYELMKKFKIPYFIYTNYNILWVKLNIKNKVIVTAYEDTSKNNMFQLRYRRLNLSKEDFNEIIKFVFKNIIKIIEKNWNKKYHMSV